MANASDRKEIRRLEKAAKLAELQRREVITQVMVSLPGRAWMWDVLSACSIFSTTHVPADALASSFQEGRRSVGLSLLADIMAHCPDQFIQAMREQNERRILDDNATARSDDALDSTALAERSGSAQPDRGDSGTESDRSERGDEDRSAPGADIYVN